MVKKINGLTGGLIAGSLVAIGGAIKDSPHEGFKPKTFIRSPIVGALVGSLLTDRFKIRDMPLLILAVIGGERIIIEGYKLLRAQKPGKFEFGEWGNKIPQLTL